MQEQFTRYDNGIKNIPTYLKKPIIIAKYNMAKPFYLDESRYENEKIEALNKEYADKIEMFTNWIEERRDSE